MLQDSDDGLLNEGEAEDIEYWRRHQKRLQTRIMLKAREKKWVKERSVKSRALWKKTIGNTKNLMRAMKRKRSIFSPSREGGSDESSRSQFQVQMVASPPPPMFGRASASTPEDRNGMGVDGSRVARRAMGWRKRTSRSTRHVRKRDVLKRDSRSSSMRMSTRKEKASKKASRNMNGEQLEARRANNFLKDAGFYNVSTGNVRKLKRGRSNQAMGPKVRKSENMTMGGTSKTDKAYAGGSRIRRMSEARRRQKEKEEERRARRLSMEDGSRVDV